MGLMHIDTDFAALRPVNNGMLHGEDEPLPEPVRVTEEDVHCAATTMAARYHVAMRDKTSAAWASYERAKDRHAEVVSALVRDTLRAAELGSRK